MYSFRALLIVLLSFNILFAVSKRERLAGKRRACQYSDNITLSPIQIKSDNESSSQAQLRQHEPHVLNRTNKLRIYKPRKKLRMMYGQQASNLSFPAAVTNPEIPAVVNPSVKTLIPKFNCAILARLGNNEIPLCKGALISNSFVITVGTGCVLINDRLYSPDDLFVVFVSYLKAQRETVLYESDVRDIILHEGCCRSGSYVPQNDIALLYLQDKVFYDYYMIPAKITRNNFLYHPAVLSSWALSNFRVFNLAADFRDAIWLVQTKFISASLCDKVISDKLFQKLMMTCASYYHADVDNNCVADLGSPLSYKGELIGLLLYKQSCGAPHSSGLFVNIGINSHWIRQTIGDITNHEENV